MGILAELEKDLVKLQPVFLGETQPSGINAFERALEKKLQGIRYEGGYCIPEAHINKLAQLLAQDKDSISKRDVIDLFLTMHDVQLSGIESEIIMTSRLESFPSMLEQCKYTLEETEKVEDLDSIQAIKRMNGWTIVFYYMKKRLLGGDIRELASFEVYNQKKVDDTGALLQNKSIKYLLERNLELKIGLRVLDHEVIRPYEKVRRGRTSQVYDDVKYLFEVDNDLKKLNANEVMKELSLMVSSTMEPIEIYFSEYGTKRFFPYLLAVGEPDLFVDSTGRVDVHPRKERERLGLVVKPGVWFNISINKMDSGGWNLLQELAITTLSIFGES